MAELPAGSIEKLMKEVNTEDLRNSREMDNLLNVLKKKKRNLEIEKQKIRVVICCSAEDEKLGSAIKESLATIEIGSFVAHDGSDLPEKIIKRIIDGLGEFDAFIPLLSADFKNSDYCSQELGVAYFKNLLIIPLSLDGTIPYGFISGFRSPPVNENNIPLDYIMKLIRDQFPTIDITQKLINALRKVDSPDKAEEVMTTIEPYFDRLNDLEINAIIDISTKNEHIQASNSCTTEYLPEFIEINRDKIEKNKLEIVLRIIEVEKEFESSPVDRKVLDQENK